MKNKYNLALPVLFLIVLACNCPKEQSKTTDTKPVAEKTTATTAPAKETVSSLTWSDYDNIYNLKSNSTDMQKDAQWKRFEGKTVSWQGTVEDVSKGSFGGLTLNIKMNPDTLTSDISLTLKEDQENKAMSPTKGNKVSFTGKLKSYGGAILPVTMDDGEIK